MKQQCQIAEETELPCLQKTANYFISNNTKARKLQPHLCWSEWQSLQQQHPACTNIVVVSTALILLIIIFKIDGGGTLAISKNVGTLFQKLVKFPVLNTLPEILWVIGEQGLSISILRYPDGKTLLLVAFLVCKVGSIHLTSCIISITGCRLLPQIV